jgi:hypothetical protein
MNGSLGYVLPPAPSKGGRVCSLLVILLVNLSYVAPPIGIQRIWNLSPTRWRWNLIIGLI